MTSPIAGEREAKEREAFEAHIKTTAWYQVLSQAKDDDDDGASVFRMARMAADAAWQARAALLEPVGEGWVMVPVEPTEEMLSRAVYAIACGTAREVALKHYRAMIAASPKSNGGMGS